MEVIEGPTVVTRPERHTAGIRMITPFQGMFAVRDTLMAELFAWLDDRGLDAGPVFFRLHVIDMSGSMDIEVGVVTTDPVVGDDRVRAGSLPAGPYAQLVYVNHGMRANKLLLGWIDEQGLTADVAEDLAGDRFGCRYEAYLTDPRTERMKTRWQIELAVRLAGATGS